MFHKKTIRDVELEGKTVLLHAELDAPLSADGKHVTSDFRVKSSLPTIKALQAKHCKIILISKLGRPGGKPNPQMSLAPVAACLQKLLDQPVSFVDDCVGEKVREAAAKLQPGHVMLLENLRFHAEEEQNDDKFAQDIAKDSGAELFVQDCFALAHRKEAGTVAITQVLPSVAGLSLEKEYDAIVDVMERPKRPLVAIIGGAKIADKIDVLKKFIELADFVAIGGAMANTFLAACGLDVADSLYDKTELALAKEIMKLAEEATKKRQFVFAIPHDAVVSHAVDKTAPTRIVDWDTHAIADVENYPKRIPTRASTIAEHEKILDIGPFSASFIAGAVQLSATVVWNGAMGVTEIAGLQGPIGPYAHGTEIVIEALVGDFGHKPFTLVGGGDTVGYIEERGLVGSFDHVSTGGGASLELMAGRKLPAVEALQDKK